MTPRNSSLSSDDPRERAFDALDHDNDERKERRHDQRQAIPTLPDVETPARIVTVELLALFERTASVNASLTLFERNVPGADAALRAFAGSYSLLVDYHEVVDWPGCFVTRVTTKGGADFTVHTGTAPPRPATTDEVAAEEARSVKP